MSKVARQPLVGRQGEVAAVLRLLDESRLVTLTGPAGVGASSVAGEVARAAIDRFPDGVWVADLGPVTDAGYITEAIACAAGLLEPAGLGVGVDDRSLLGRVMERGCGRNVLVVLDHCRHLQTECALLADMMLASCPDIRILATSDAPLGVATEIPYPLTGLPSNPANPDAPALELFRHRAGGRVIDPATAAAACHRLNGLPLAVALAAGAVADVTVAELASRLEAALPGEHQPSDEILEAAFDLRRTLLAGPERALLDRLAVFAGPFDVEAAAVVCAGGPVKRSHVPDMLDRLVGAGLLGATSGSILRLQDGLRGLGRRKLAETGGEADLQSSHARHFTRLAGQAATAIHGPKRDRWLEHLDLHRHDLRAAFSWSLEAEPATALQLAAHLGWFWYLAGQRNEGRHKLEAAIRRAGSTSPIHHAEVAFALSLHEWFEGRIASAMSYAEEAIRLYEELNEPQTAAVAGTLVAVFSRYLGDTGRAVDLERRAADVLGEHPAGWRAAVAMLLDADAAAAAGDPERAAAAARRALAAFQTLNDEWGTGAANFALGVAARMQGNLPEAAERIELSLGAARSLRLGADVPALLVELGNLAAQSGDFALAGRRFGEAVRVANRRGDRSALAFARNGQGASFRRQGKLIEAARHHAEALDIYRRQGNRAGLAHTLCQLGRVADLRGDHPAARRHFSEGLEHAADSRDPMAVAIALEGAASVALASDEPMAAALLLGAAAGLRSSTGTALPARDREDVGRLERSAKRAAGQAYLDSYQAGRGLDMAAAVQAGRDAIRAGEG